MPEEKKLRVRVPRDRGVAQIITLARRLNRPVSDVLTQLRSARVKAIDGGPIYSNSKVDIDAVMKAIAAKPQEGEPANLVQLHADAVKARAVAAVPDVARPYIGDETQPQPQHIIEGALSTAARDFPRIPNPDPDKNYRPIHISASRQAYMVDRGYRFVVDPAHIARIGQGTLERYVNSRGRVQYKDRELAYRDMSLVTAQRAQIRKQFIADRQAVQEAFEANIDVARSRLGRGADTKLSAFTMPEGEALERKEAAESARHGVTRVILDPEKIGAEK